MRSLFHSMHAKIMTIVSLIIFICIYLVIASLVTPFSSSAIITTHVAYLSPAVAGRIISLDVHDDEYLTKGQKILQVDPIPYQIAVSQAEANISLVTSKVASLQASVGGAQQTIAERKASYINAQEKFNQYQKLYKTGIIPLRDYQQTQADLAAKLASLNEAKAALENVQKSLGEYINGKNVNVIQAENQLKKAQYELRHTLLIAPQAGYLADVNAQVGGYAEPGVLKIAFIRNDNWWIDAYFKESQLRLIQPGSETYAITSLYPGKVFKAKVLSISYGVQANDVSESSALPVSVEQVSWLSKQRYFPVRLRLEIDPMQYPLRMGATASIAVINPHRPLLNMVAHGWYKLKSMTNYIL